MSTAKFAQGARTQLSGAAAAINSLASGAYVVVGTITHNSGGKVPIDTKVEVTVTPGTTSGNKQAVLFAQTSPDGSVWSTGPSTGTSTTDEANLILLGSLPLNTASGQQRREFSIAAVMAGGLLPFATRLILKNDSGATFAASGNDVYTQDYNGDVT